MSVLIERSRPFDVLGPRRGRDDPRQRSTIQANLTARHGPAAGRGSHAGPKKPVHLPASLARHGSRLAVARRPGRGPRTRSATPAADRPRRPRRRGAASGCPVARMLALVATTSSRGAAADVAAMRSASVTAADRPSAPSPVATRSTRPTSAARVGVQTLAAEQHRHRRLRPDDPLRHPRHPAAGVQRRGAGSPARSARSRPRSHVGGEREVQPGADRRPVDGGEGRQRALGEREEPGVDVLQRLGARLAGRGRARRGRRLRRTRASGRPRR